MPRAERSLPCPQASASVPASGITPSGRSSLRRPSRKRTDGPGAAPGCRLPPSWAGGWRPPPAPGEAGWPLSPSRGLCHSGGPAPEQPHSALLSSCSATKGNRGVRMQAKGRRRRLWGSCPFLTAFLLQATDARAGSAAREMKCPTPSSLLHPGTSMEPPQAPGPPWGTPSPGCPTCCS